MFNNLFFEQSVLWHFSISCFLVLNLLVDIAGDPFLDTFLVLDIWGIVLLAKVICSRARVYMW
ncbi:hypothetical protein JOM56_013153 [Amanita muscaria]